MARNEKSKLKTYRAGYLTVNQCDFYLEVIRLRFISEVRIEAVNHNNSLYAVNFTATHFSSCIKRPSPG